MISEDIFDQDVEGIDRNVDLGQGNAQGTDQQDLAGAEQGVGDPEPSEIQEKHGAGAADEGKQSKPLHPADELKSSRYVLKLGERIGIGILLVFRMQGADEVRQSQEAPVVGEEQKRDGRKEQSRSGKGQFHGGQ